MLESKSLFVSALPSDEIKVNSIACHVFCVFISGAKNISQISDDTIISIWLQWKHEL